MLDRLALAISVSAERFLKIVGPVAAAASDATQAERRPVQRTARSAGRGSVVRQAVQNLLHFPSTALRINAQQRAALAFIDAPGVDVLKTLLDDLAARPATNTGQVLERWRDQEIGERLARLASAEMITPDAQAAGNELATAVQKLLDLNAGARLDALLQRARDSSLSDDEKRELTLLMSARPRQV
jgi:DNA primase